MNNIAVIENIIQILQYIKIIGPFPFTPSPPKFMKNNHIINFVTINDILYDKQFGFRKGHSTNHASITLVDKVARALDTRKIVVGVYFDLRKAFDTAPHTIILDKLYRMKIRENLRCLIKKYLEDRIQFVNYNDHSSRTQPINIGVPQGSTVNVS